MFDSRFFSDAYDLYRPTVVTSDSGEQTISNPATATATAQPCRWFPTPGRLRVTDTGIDMDYDAVLLYPNAQTLRPEQHGQQPDHVKVSGREYVILAAWPMAGATHGKKALLREKKSG